MNAWLRIAIMVLVSEITFMIIAAGFDIQGMLFAGSFIVVFWTLPLIIIISIFHLLQKWLGNAATVLIATVGLLPTIFVFGIAPAIGVTGGVNSYAQSLCLAGWLWSAAWLLTSQWKVSAPRW